MRRISNVDFILVILLLLAGCAKTETPGDDTDEKRVISVTGNVPGTTSDRVIFITATMPRDYSSSTRAFLSQEESGDVNISWRAGDEVHVVFVQNDTKIAREVFVEEKGISSDGKTAKLEIELPDDITENRFDLFGAYGGEGLLLGDPTQAILPTDPGQSGSLESLQQGKGVMLSFSVKGVSITTPRVKADLQHVGSLFSVTIKNKSDISLDNIAEVRLVAKTTGWAYNSGSGGNSYNLITREFRDSQSGDGHISFKTLKSTISSGDFIMVWGWYPSLPEVVWPTLELELRNSDGILLHKSSNNCPPIESTVPGKSYSFTVEWDGTELLFPNGKYYDKIDERIIDLRTLAKRTMEQVYLPYELEARASFTPNIEITNRVKLDTYERWHLKYRLDKDEHGYAYLLIPLSIVESNAKTPLVICLHPVYPGGKDRVAGVYNNAPANSSEADARIAEQYAVDLVKNGFITFAPDKAAFGERRNNKDSNDYLEEQLQYSWALSTKYPGWNVDGKSVYDLKVALDYLLEMPFVDEGAIGCIGHTIGAWDMLLFSGLDHRVKVSAGSSGGMLQFRQEFWRDADYLERYLSGKTSKDINVNTNIFYMLMAPKPFLTVFSLLLPGHDTETPQLIEGYKDVYKYYQKVNNTNRADFSYYMNSTGDKLTPDISNLIYRWLEEKLK